MCILREVAELLFLAQSTAQFHGYILSLYGDVLAGEGKCFDVMAFPYSKNACAPNLLVQQLIKIWDGAAVGTQEVFGYLSIEVEVNNQVFNLKVKEEE